jgi:DNA-binding NtrC family response regulator
VGFALYFVDSLSLQRDGISLMEEIHAINPYMPIIIITALEVLKVLWMA